MARTKVESPGVELNSWDAVDEALAEIGVLSSQVAAEEAKYNADEQKRRAVLTEKNQAKTTRIVELELGIKKYAENNRSDFGKSKSRELKHGIINFRLSPPAVKCVKGFTFASALELAKRSPKWSEAFVRVKEELNKEAILNEVARHDLQAPDADNQPNNGISLSELRMLGLTVTQDETFGYDCKLAITN